jgi:hypothetical protein
MTQDERTIVKYVMEVLQPFRYWTIWMSKGHTVTLHDVITVYNDMFDHLDGVMQALARKKAQWKEDLFFAVKCAWQKLSKYYTEVTAMTGTSAKNNSVQVEGLRLSGGSQSEPSETSRWWLTPHPAPRPRVALYIALPWQFHRVFSLSSSTIPNEHSDVEG